MSPEKIELDIGDLKYKIDNLKDHKNVINTAMQARRSVITSSGQAKRNAYQIEKVGGYGVLMIDFKLLNEMAHHAYRDGDLVYNRGVDKAAVARLIKRYNSKLTYSPLAIEVFNDLNTLSGLPPHPSSGKSKLLHGGAKHSTRNDGSSKNSNGVFSRWQHKPITSK